MAIITSDSYAIEVCKQMGIDHANVRRVVIDATASEPLRVYIERFGGDELLRVKLPPPAQVELVTNA